MSTAKTRIGVAASVSLAVVASLTGTAGARIPDGKLSDRETLMQPRLSFSGFNLGLYLPVDSGLSTIDSWITRQGMSQVAARESRFASPDAVERAIARRNR